MRLDFEKYIHDHLPNLCVQLAWLPLEMAIWEQTVEDFSFLISFLSLLLKVPTSMMSKYYPWKFNLVMCLLISFHLLPLHFEVFVKRLRMIIPFCFLLKSTWCNVKKGLSSKLLILQFRESDFTGNSTDSYMAIVIFKQFPGMHKGLQLSSVKSLTPSWGNLCSQGTFIGDKVGLFHFALF